MNYKIIKNQSKESLKGFKTNIFGFLALAMLINLPLTALISNFTESIILITMINLVAAAIILPTVIAIVKFIIENKKKASYKESMPSFKIILSSLGVLAINKVIVQAVLGMILIPVVIIGFFLLMFMPGWVILLFGLIVGISMVIVSLFIYTQGILGLCIIIDGGSFKLAMTESWNILFKNFKMFLRTATIMLPVSILQGALIVGMIFGLVVTMLVDPILGVLLLGGLTLIILMAILALGIGLLPKLVSIIYIAYMKTKESKEKHTESINFSDTMEHTNFDFKENVEA
ncbi:MAG: hypothetical protein ACRC6T_00140 [Sarcina sp.]